MKTDLPFILSNFAMTADGKIAFSSCKFTPFSSRRDHNHMMKLRATADAVMCGARTIEVTRTVLGDGGEPFRKLRLKNGLTRPHLRVVVSGGGSINPDTKIFKNHISPIIVLTTGRASKAKLHQLRKVADEVKVFGRQQVNFPMALRWLNKKWNVKRLLCEGGGELNSALIRAGLLDELHLTVCPTIFGGRQASTVAEGNGFDRLANASRFELASFKRIGNEVFTIWRRKAV